MRLLSNLILLSCISIIVTAIGENNATDREALLEFKNKVTDDPLGVLISWNDSVHFCRWFGITCGRRHQQVTVLNLTSLQISGTISPHIGNLSFLREILLSNNSFSQEIPSELGRLCRLQTLSLSRNSLSGKIPTNISNCSELRTLNVSYNNLTGEIPSELGSLSNLNVITIGANSLITGSIPSSFGNLTSLQALYIFQTSVNKHIPNSLGQLRKLEALTLEFNQLSGPIPRSIFNLSLLTDIYLAGNQLQGSLPPDMGNTLPNLQHFTVSDNRLKGNFPPSISNASSLQLFQIVDNEFTGKIPSLVNLNKLVDLEVASNLLGSRGNDTDELSFICSLMNATGLRTVRLDSNHFGGEVPKCIGNLSSNSLLMLDTSDNFIVGEVPSEIRNLRSLTSLSFMGNTLTGQIPADIGMLKNLVRLNMARNGLSGELPNSLGNLTSLTELYLNVNNFHASIPSSLGRCTRLLRLNLSDNYLSGTIPPEVLSLSSLSTGLSLSRNRLTGFLSNKVGKLRNNAILEVSKNMLSGQIPTSLGECTSLEFLDLSENSFSGSIPSSLDSLRAITYIDLGQNKLSGEVPKFLGTFVFLLSLNLSHNNFEGPLPTEGIFKNSSAVSVFGNRGLCGGIPGLGLPRCEPPTSEPTHPKKKTLRIILVSVILASLIFAIFLVFTCIMMRQLEKNPKEHELDSSGKSISSVSYHSLVKATNGFSSDNLLGTGSFGSVYKGVLNRDNIVAIKVLNPHSHGAFKSFAVECEVKRNIRHRNLVKILTACSGIDYVGGNFKALVYEYMPNGNLEMWLHSASNGCRNTMVLFRKLGFLERLQIAIDVASGLEYLHLHCQPPIAHCDLKPSNVLLDAEMTANVGDFGLARILQKATSIYSSDNNNSSCFGVGLTIGYAPPEYGFGSEVSIRGDVYSYGILLLEMFTGKRPTAEMFNESLTLRNFVNEALPDNLRSILDPTLVNDEEEMAYMIRTGNAESFKECSKAILEIGLACSEFAPRERMSMDAVVTELNEIKIKLVLPGLVVN